MRKTPVRVVGRAPARQGVDRATMAGDHPRWGLAIDLSKCHGLRGLRPPACYAEQPGDVGEQLMQREPRDVVDAASRRILFLTVRKGVPQEAP